MKSRRKTERSSQPAPQAQEHMWRGDASTLLGDMSSPRCLRLSHRPTRPVMEVSLLDVPTQPGRGDLAFSMEPRMTECSIVVLHGKARRGRQKTGGRFTKVIAFIPGFQTAWIGVT